MICVNTPPNKHKIQQFKNTQTVTSDQKSTEKDTTTNYKKLHICLENPLTTKRKNTITKIHTHQHKILPNIPPFKTTNISPTKPKQLIKLTCTNLKQARPTGLAQTQRKTKIKHKVKENQSTNIPNLTKNKQTRYMVTHPNTHKKNTINPHKITKQVPHIKKYKLENIVNQTKQKKYKNYQNTHQKIVRKYIHKIKETRPTAPPPQNKLKTQNQIPAT